MVTSRTSSGVLQRCRPRTFSCEEGLHRAVVAQAPTRPIEPTKRLLLFVRTKALKRNLTARSKWVTMPTGSRRMIASRSAATASDALMRESIE